MKLGDPVSLKLFTCLLENQFRKLEWENKYGINIDGLRLTHLRFADDIILLANSAIELELMLTELDKVSRETGLTMNTGKTKLMTNATEEPVYIGGEPLEYVQDYMYLGQNLSFHNNMEKEIKKRIGLAWKKFWSLKFILMDKSLKQTLKVEVLEKCVLPVILYGCQTWALTAKQRL